MEHSYSLYPVLRTDKPNKNGLCPLYLRYTYRRKWKNIPLKITLESKFWNISDNEPRKSCPNRTEILNLIRTNKTSIEGKILSYCRENGDYPNADELLLIIDKKKKNSHGWDYYFDLYVENQINNENVEPSTLSIYNQLKSKLASFLEHKKINWSWEAIGLDFYNQFIYYLRTVKLRNGKIGHADSGIGKQIKTLKSFLNFVSIRYGLIQYNQFRNFKTLREEPDFVILNPKDIETMKSALGISFLYKNKIKLNEREYEILRGMLLLCKTGLNIADLYDLQIDNLLKTEELLADNFTEAELSKLKISEKINASLEEIQNTHLYIKKNRKKLKHVSKKNIPIIPVTDELAILLSLSFKGVKSAMINSNILYHAKPHEKTDNYSVFTLSKKLDDLKTQNDDQKIAQIETYPFLLKRISQPIFNKEIKLVMKKIGIDYNEIIYQNTSKNKVKEIRVPKYQLISSRTGRRTYITTQLSKNVTSEVVMRTVGISKSDTLRRYENLSEKTIIDVIKTVNKNPQKNLKKPKS